MASGWGGPMMQAWVVYAIAGADGIDVKLVALHCALSRTTIWNRDELEIAPAEEYRLRGSLGRCGGSGEHHELHVGNRHAREWREWHQVPTVAP